MSTLTLFLSAWVLFEGVFSLGVTLTWDTKYVNLIKMRHIPWINIAQFDYDTEILKELRNYNHKLFLCPP